MLSNYGARKTPREPTRNLKTCSTV